MQSSTTSQEISNNNPISPHKITANQNCPAKSLFSPSLTKSLKCSCHGFVCYNQRNNLLIVSAENIIEIYDATTLAKIKFHELDDWAEHVSYCEELDTYIIGCDSGMIYSYNASSDELKLLQKYEQDVFTVESVSSGFYAFVLAGSKKLHIGNLENENVVNLDWSNRDPKRFHHLVKSSLLLLSFDYGFVKIFKADKLPHLKGLCTVQAHRNKIIYELQSFCLNGKEYVITSSDDETLKIWHFIKGRIRLLRVVQTHGRIAHSIVYLENCKMVAVSYETNYIDFFKMPSWRLERTFYLDKYTERHGLFLMKDRNSLGVVGNQGYGYHFVDFIQLYPQEEEKEV